MSLVPVPAGGADQQTGAGEVRAERELRGARGAARGCGGAAQLRRGARVLAEPAAGHAAPIRAVSTPAPARSQPRSLGKQRSGADPGGTSAAGPGGAEGSRSVPRDGINLPLFPPPGIRFSSACCSFLACARVLRPAGALVLSFPSVLPGAASQPLAELSSNTQGSAGCSDSGSVAGSAMHICFALNRVVPHHVPIPAGITRDPGPGVSAPPSIAPPSTCSGSGGAAWGT